VLTLDTKTQTAMDLQVAVLQPTQLSPEKKAFGRIQDVTDLVTQVFNLASARTASRASQAELERLKTLAQQNNASQRSLQTAEAAASRDQLQVETAQLHLAQTWGSALAGRNDLPAVAQSLAALSNALVLAQIPSGEAALTTPQSARIVGP